MQKGKRSSTVPVVSQPVSVMTTLENNSPNRITAAQIFSKMNHMGSNYHAATPLNEMVDSVPYARAIGSRVMEEFFPSEMKDRVAEEVTGPAATNFSRMKFFLEAGIFGLSLPLNTDEASKRKRAVAIEALLMAAYFGSGQACQLLLEQNEKGVITLTVEEIQNLIRAQIYWHDKAFGPYSVETGHHDYTNVDVPSQAAQLLPALLTYKKAWDAMRQDPALYADVLRVAYHSGRPIQTLIDANEEGSIVNLKSAELRHLVQNQINQYFAAQLPGATIKVEDQQTPLLTIPSKVWAALMDAPKESWTSLLKFLQDLDLRITNPAALAAFTEQNPMVFKAYFESKAGQALVSVADLDPKTKNHIATRNRVVQALLGLRHAAFKPDNKALLNMRPAIVEKKKTNDVADALAATAITAEAQRVAQKKSEIRADTVREIRETEQEAASDLNNKEGFGVSYKREGFEKAFRTSLNVETLATAIGKRDSKPGEKKYQDRIDAFMASPAGQEYQARKKARDAKLGTLPSAEQATVVSLAQKEQGACRLLDEEFEVFKATKENERLARVAELEAMKANEKALNQALVESNPITESVRWLFLVAAQDLAMFGTLTHDWLKNVEVLLVEDLRAFNAGEFAYEFTAKTMTASEKSKEKLPLHMLNNPAYIALFDIYRRDPANFRKNIQDQLIHLNGSVESVNVIELLKAFPVNSDPKKNTEKSVQNAVAHYVVEGHVDPLSHAFNQLTLLKMFVMITEISPQHDLAHAKFLDEAGILRNRLNKVLARQNSSPAADYVKTALFVLFDKRVLSDFAKRDESNPFRCVLARHSRSQENNFESKEYFTVELALEQLSDNTERAITAANINNALRVLSYLKKMLGIETQISDADLHLQTGEARSPQKMTAVLRQRMASRRDAGQETEIDVLLVKCFFDYIDVMYAKFCQDAAGQAKLTVDASEWTHRNQANIMREQLGVVTSVNTRRSSVSSDSSPLVQRERSNSMVSAAASMSLSPSVTTPPVVGKAVEEEAAKLNAAILSSPAVVVAPVLAESKTLENTGTIDSDQPVSTSPSAMFVPPPPVEKSVELFTTEHVEEKAGPVKVSENKPVGKPPAPPPPPPPPVAGLKATGNPPPPPVVAPPPPVVVPLSVASVPSVASVELDETKTAGAVEKTATPGDNVAARVLPPHVIARRTTEVGASLVEQIVARKKPAEQEEAENTQIAYDMVANRRKEEKDQAEKEALVQLDEEIARKKAASESLTLKEKQREIFLATQGEDEDDTGYESPDEEDDITIDLQTGRLTGTGQWDGRVYSVDPSHRKLPTIFAGQPKQLEVLEQIKAGTFVPAAGK